MKKKLASLDMRIQLAGVVFGLLLVTFVLHMVLVSPQSAKAAKLQSEIDSTTAQISQRRIDLKAAGERPTIETADLFRLSRAMPDRTDMPGIILTLSQVAREAGITFNSIEPTAPDATAATTGGYQTQRIHLLFDGDFYGLNDFLYRLRSLVTVRHGKLAASGRLFNADTVNFTVQAQTFPKVSAELYVNAYIYEPTVAAPAAVPSTDTTATTTTEAPAPDPSATPSGATAAGATP